MDVTVKLMIKGIGTDIVDIPRMRVALDRNKNIIAKILTGKEIDQLPTQDISSKRFVESLSARFAAKEAFAKSLGLSVFGIGFHNIEILKPEGSSKPEISLLDVPSLLEGPSSRKMKFHLSISHSDSSAIATVIAESHE